MSFLVTLQSNFQHVMLYENPELQQKARSIIPHQEMSAAAEDKLKEAREADPGIVMDTQKTCISESYFMSVKYHVKKKKSDHNT